ncbi:hypothetical protein J8J40_26015, partial [Mycobacterium tuberculosis]|nr:hypothetical protein [Mycobacterium tuberculosis]
PGTTASFAELAGSIKATIAKSRAAAAIAARHDDIEDVRAGGTKLVDVAKQFNMTTPRSVVLDRNGNGPDGKPVDLPEGQRLARAIFAADPGIEAEPVT